MLSKMYLYYLHLIWILMWLIFSLTLCYFLPIYPICFLFLFISFFLSPLVLLVFLWLHWIFFGFSLAITIAYFILVAALKIMAYILAYLNCHNVHSSDNYTTSHTVYEFIVYFSFPILSFVIILLYTFIVYWKVYWYFT